MYRGVQVPELAQIQKYRSVNLQARQGRYQPLYDYQTYALAGTTEMSFFAVPQGQSSKTLADTNMRLAAQLPSPQSFLVTAIMIEFWPNAFPGAFGAQALTANINDVYELGKSGYVDFRVGDKQITEDGPLNKFPSDTRLAGMAALSDATTAGANLQGRVDYATWAGKIYEIDPVLIEPAQSINFKIKWSSAVAITADARLGVRLSGVLYQFG